MKETRYSNATRTVLTATQVATGAGALSVALVPSAGYKAELQSPAGLYTTLNVQFAASGEQTLTQEIQLTLHEPSAKPPATPAKKKKKPTKSQGTGKPAAGKKPPAKSNDSAKGREMGR